MDAVLKRLADASLDVSAAEEAVGEAAFHTARERLDGADAVLAELRERWPAMSRAERGVVGPAARAVRARLDGASRRIPRLSALSQAAPLADPEQELEPVEEALPRPS